MRTAITLATRHGSKDVSVIATPDVPITDQMAGVKELAASRENAKYSEVSLWTSDGGLVRKLKFSKPAAKPKPEDPAKP